MKIKNKKGFTLANKTRQGFTLVELLVVISILGLLAGLLISNVTGARERARDSQRKADLQQIKEALRMYHNDFGGYPNTGSGGTIHGCGTTLAPTNCAWGGEFKKDSAIYMKLLPKDPSSSDDTNVYYVYSIGADQDNFTLYGVLENKSDQDISRSQTRCGGSVTNAYYVCAD